MEARKDVQWLPKNWATGNVTIENVEVVKNGSKEDKQLTVACDSGTYRLSVWGSNWNRLIDRFGSNTDAWKGKPVFILRESRPNEKDRIVLSPQ